MTVGETSMAGRKRDGRGGDGMKPAGGDSGGIGAEADEPDQDPAWVDGVRRGLLDWYREAGRTLPWRADRDAYRILVSELMLVQTTVAAVIPYFERFLRRFPDIRTLAEADEADVLKAWEGLGYYRRARQLQAAARQVVREHGGTIPDDPAGVRALPGVGPYIAGAVLSFAFDRPEPIVEANSQRVLARLVTLREDVKSAAARRRIWQAAGRLVPPRGAGDFNQAMMDLGALVCTPRQPSCLLCPVATHCGARRLGLQDVIPRTTPKPPPTAVSEACALVGLGGRILIVRRGRGGLWEEFWEFPTIHVAGPDPAGRSFGAPVELTEGVRRLTGITAEIEPPSSTIRYGVTNYRVTLEVSRGSARSGTPLPGPGLIDARWVEPERLSDFTFSSAGRRLIARIRRDAQ
jgi:A/G-specific adenine glycosylase